MPVRSPVLAQGVFCTFVKSSGLIIDTASDMDKSLFDRVPPFFASTSSTGLDQTCSVLSLGPGFGKPPAWLGGPCGSPVFGAMVFLLSWAHEDEPRRKRIPKLVFSINDPTFLR